MIPEKCPDFLCFVLWYHGKKNNWSRSLCSLKPSAVGFTRISLVFGSMWAPILANPSRSEIDKVSPLLLQSFELFPLTCMWGWWRQKGTSKRVCSSGPSLRAEGGVRVACVLHPIQGLGPGCDGQPWKPACGGIQCGAQSMPHSGHCGHTSQQLSWQGRWENCCQGMCINTNAAQNCAGHGNLHCGGLMQPTSGGGNGVCETSAQGFARH